MILFLVRHALTPVTGHKLTGRLPGFDLSDTGRSQAAETALRLAELPLSAIYSSPMERCLQTAQAIASHHRLQVRSVEALSEIDYGRWQGRTLSSLARTKGWRQLRARPGDFRFPGGETIREAQTRAMGAVEELRLEHPGKAVVACTHADMIKLVVAACLGLGIDLYDRISVAPASVTAVQLGEGVPVLLGSGDSGGYRDLVQSLRTSQNSAASGKNGSGKDGSGKGNRGTR